jgi:broad specificity phosphatase PhoE
MQKPFLRLLGILLFLSIFTPCLAQNKATVVYLVRHAEKNLTNPEDKDPPLSQAGSTRAMHLAEKLKREKIDVIYSTSYQRTQSTVEPLALQKKIPVKTYQATDYVAIKELIQKDSGKTILICGHSNNLIPIIEALGAQPPAASISEDEYNHFFKVTIDGNGKVSAIEEEYQ